MNRKLKVGDKIVIDWPTIHRIDKLIGQQLTNIHTRIPPGEPNSTFIVEGIDASCAQKRDPGSRCNQLFPCPGYIRIRSLKTGYYYNQDRQVEKSTASRDCYGASNADPAGKIPSEQLTCFVFCLAPLLAKCDRPKGLSNEHTKWVNRKQQ